MASQNELLARLRGICANDRDLITLDDFQTLTVEQLRTVVALAADGGIEAITGDPVLSDNRAPRHCYLIQTLVDYLTFPGNVANPRHPVTRRPIGHRQRQLIFDAYRRITGNDVPVPVHAPPPPPRPARPLFNAFILRSNEMYAMARQGAAFTILIIHHQTGRQEYRLPAGYGIPLLMRLEDKLTELLMQHPYEHGPVTRRHHAIDHQHYSTPRGNMDVLRLNLDNGLPPPTGTSVALGDASFRYSAQFGHIVYAAFRRIIRQAQP